jgi:CheY-like chemotaxis protein
MSDKTINVLFLEDNMLASHLTLSALSRELPEMKFHSAGSLGKARQLVSQHTFDLFILDVELPDGTAFDFLNDLQRKKHPVPHAIFLTATGLPEYQRKAEKAGAARFFEKPVNITDLAAVVRQVLGSSVDKEQRPSFEGTLTCLTPMDLVQLKCLSHANMGLEFTNLNGQRGTVWFQDGDVVHSASDKDTGEAAFFQIMAWKRGKIRELSTPATLPLTIVANWNDLLMRAAQFVDEQSSKS